MILHTVLQYFTPRELFQPCATCTVYNKLLPLSLALCFLRQAHRQMMIPSIMTAAITTRTATPSRLPSVKTTVMLPDSDATPAGLQA